MQISLRFEDGSIAGILYTSKGNPKSGKERVEVFAGGITAIIDDFRRAEVHGARIDNWKGGQDKGHAEQLRRFVEAVASGRPSPIALAELESGTHATFRAAAAAAGHATSEVTEIER
ncbi:MAG TPA: hypothetical protein VHG09_00570 [Longimicrobiales bacterium]|nr:hypothetical protein [Longimicrobiales bacterium]